MLGVITKSPEALTVTSGNEAVGSVINWIDDVFNVKQSSKSFFKILITLDSWVLRNIG